MLRVVNISLLMGVSFLFVASVLGALLDYEVDAFGAVERLWNRLAQPKIAATVNITAHSSLRWQVVR